MARGVSGAAWSGTLGISSESAGLAAAFGGARLERPECLGARSYHCTVDEVKSFCWLPLIQGAFANWRYPVCHLSPAIDVIPLGDVWRGRGSPRCSEWADVTPPCQRDVTERGRVEWALESQRCAAKCSVPSPKTDAVRFGRPLSCAEASPTA